MKYICLGYFDEKKWETMSESDQQAFMDGCFTYDDLLRKNGHIVGAIFRWAGNEEVGVEA